MRDPIQPAPGGHIATCPTEGCSWEQFHPTRSYLTSRYALHQKTHQKKGADQ